MDPFIPNCLLLQEHVVFIWCKYELCLSITFLKCILCEIMFTWKNLLSLQINISLIVILLWFIQIWSPWISSCDRCTWSHIQKCRTGTSKLEHRKKTTPHATLIVISDNINNGIRWKKGVLQYLCTTI